MHKKAVLFDLDNTLYHYDPCNLKGLAAAHRLLQERNVEIAFEQFLKLHYDIRGRLEQELPNQAAWHNRVLYFKEIVETLTDKSDAGLMLDLYGAYTRRFLESMEPNPDTHEVLGVLGREYRLALVTNQTTLAQLEKLHRLGISHYFSAIVTSEEVGTEKPNPEIFRFALDKLEVSADEAVMVGDHFKGDVLGARSAGIEAYLLIQYATDYATGPLADLPKEGCLNRLRDLLPILTRPE